MRRRCQRNSVSGVTSHPARLDRASAAAIAPRKLRSVSVSSGRSICRRSTASWWRNTMISRSLERPDRTVSRASDARNRYKIRYTRNQDWLSSLQVNAHDRVFGTHRFRGRGGGVLSGFVVDDAVVGLAGDEACGCPKWCRCWSGGIFVFVDEAIAAGRSEESKGQRVVSRVVVGGGVSGWSLV